MRLDALFDAELRFDEEHSPHFPSYGDSDWIGYAEGTGTVTGDKVAGKARWTNVPRRREDGVWLLHFYGSIETRDEAVILFEFSGYNLSLGDRFSYDDGRSVCASITFRSQDEQYRWLNDVFGVLEAKVVPSSEIEVWEVRAYACTNEMA